MLIFDIEADGLLNTIKLVWCLTIYDSDTDEYISYPPDRVEEGVRKLQDALDNDIPICGHNIIGYDIPALHKIYPWFNVSYEKETLVKDTLVIARLIYTDLNLIDLGMMKSGKLPSKLFKSQTLRAWGYRLGELKGDYSESDDAWECYNPDMLIYNKQDVVVTKKLWDKLNSINYSEKAIDLECRVAFLMFRQEQNGFCFDVKKAEKLAEELRERSETVNNELKAMIPKIPDKVFVPKRDNKTLGYKAGVPIQRYKEFNPTSRMQIEYVFRQMYKYSPENIDLYDTGTDDTADIDLSRCRLKIDESTFQFIAEDEKAPEEVKNLAKKLNESLLLSKRLGQLADGRNAWLKEYNPKDHRIHGRVIGNGCVSGRAAHHSPNLAQIPAIGSPYGKECRELFTAGGWYQAGIDACGLELRCLAHYMSPYDDGEYAQEILNGDIHTKNQLAAGLEKRNQAKTFIYAFLYGAGDSKIGKIIGGDEKDGKRIKRQFLKATPAIKLLRDAVQDSLVETERGHVIHWKRHYLRGLDGRLLNVRSPHSALNLLLQGAGAVVCKTWIVQTEKRLLERGLKHGWDGDFAFMGWIHDEIQVACRTKKIAEIVVQEAQKAMRDTQEIVGFRMQLDTDGKIGRNWADCH